MYNIALRIPKVGDLTLSLTHRKHGQYDLENSVSVMRAPLVS
jgi:hypothetical protein